MVRPSLQHPLWAPLFSWVPFSWAGAAGPCLTPSWTHRVPGGWLRGARSRSPLGGPGPYLGLLLAFLYTAVLLLFQLSLLSIVTPKYLYSSTSATSLPKMLRGWEAGGFFLKSIAISLVFSLLLPY
uniref:Uncharacterized protein n=1 Tax=Oryzias latipes TaxID=8090 RepID=A0A3P9ILP0_ORYLA